MNVLYVTQYFSDRPTHASTVTTYEIVTRLAKRGHTVTVVSADAPGIMKTYTGEAINPRISNGLPLPLLPPKWYDGFSTLLTHTLAYIPLLANVLLSNQKVPKRKFDAIVSMYHPTHLATVTACLLSRILKLPLVVKIYDFIIETKEPQKLKRMYHLALGKINVRVLKSCNSIILVQSPELGGVIKEECAIDDRRLVIFPNGVDTSVFRPDIECDELRRKLGLDGKTVILYLGGLYQSKHPELLVKALSRILKENKDLMLLFVGEGPEKSELMLMTERLGLQDFVNLMGSVEHDSVPALVSLADVAIGPLAVSFRPSIYGSVPLSVLEYMACERPVIVCAGAVSQSLVLDGYTGVSVQPGDVDGLSSAILNLINNREFSKTIAQSGREHVEKTCSWNVLISKLERVLNQVVDSASN